VIAIDNFGKELVMGFQEGSSRRMKEGSESFETSSPMGSPSFRNLGSALFFFTRAMVLLVGLVLVSGCGSEPSYRQAFNSSEQIQGNTESISA
jgi:hypothetical protein